MIATTRSLRTAGAAGLFILAAAQCGENDVPVTRCTPGVVVLFVDHSASTQRASIPREVEDSLSRIPDRYMGCGGDRLHSFLVDRRTRGRAVRMDATSAIPAPPVQTGSRSSFLADSVEYSRRRGAEARTIEKQVSAFVNVQHAAGNRDSTDLLGTLEVASEMLGELPPDAPRRLIYLSDMFESMSSPGRRDFDTRPPRSLEEARRWAQEDSANVLPQMRLSAGSFRGARVSVLSRAWGDKQGSEFVREYWYRIFEAVGVRRAHIRFY